MGLATRTKGGATNTEVVHTIAAPTDASSYHVLESYCFSYDITPPSAVELTIESPAGTVIWSHWITAGGTGPVLVSGSGIDGAKGQALIVRLPPVVGGVGIASTVMRNH